MTNDGAFRHGVDSRSSPSRPKGATCAASRPGGRSATGVGAEGKRPEASQVPRLWNGRPIGVITYSLAALAAVVELRVEDYYLQRQR
jgi:hypothetical protein